MKILIHLQSATELQCHEALSMAFALASFDHDIQLWLDDKAVHLIDQKSLKLKKMLSSLEMYDMPKTWVSQASLDYLSNQNPSTNNDKETEANSTNWLSQLMLLPNAIDFDKDFELMLNL